MFSHSLSEDRGEERGKLKEEGEIEDRETGKLNKKRTQSYICTSQAFEDCSTIYTMLLLLNLNILLGRRLYELFQIEQRGAISGFFISLTGDQRFIWDRLTMNLA